MKPRYDYELIRDYLHGLVDQRTAQEIRDLIRTDEVARSIASGILQLEHDFNGDEVQIESYIDQLRQKQLNTIREGQPQRKTVAFSVLRIAATIALLAALGISSWYFLSDRETGDLISRELSQPYPLAIAERGANEIDKGFELYLRGEYADATVVLDDITNPDVTVVFYNGLSHLYAGNYDKALNLLSSPTLDQSRYAQQAQWYRSLALIKSEKGAEAKKLLSAIATDPTHYKRTSAKEILDKLD